MYRSNLLTATMLQLFTLRLPHEIVLTVTIKKWNTELMFFVMSANQIFRDLNVKTIYKYENTY